MRPPATELMLMSGVLLDTPRRPIRQRQAWSLGLTLWEEETPWRTRHYLVASERATPLRPARPRWLLAWEIACGMVIVAALSAPWVPWWRPVMAWLGR